MLPQRVHRLRLADDGAKAVRPRLVVAQLLDLAPQASGLEGACHNPRDLVEIERFVGEVKGAQLHGVDRSLDAHERREQDDQHVRIERLHLTQDGQAVRVRQAVVQEHEIDAFLELLQSRLAIGGFPDLIPVALQPLAERPANEVLVVDN